MKTKLIDDFPSSIDEFGGHDKIASAICDLIVEEKGGKAIALSGDYGSGKSTVINLLKEKLTKKSTKKKEYFVFIYDVWKHHNDPIRRSFLEELHFYLKKNELIGDEYNDDIDILQKKRTITKNTTKTRLTLIGRIAAIITFFAPIVLLAMSKVIENLFDSSTDSQIVFNMDSAQWFSVLFILFWLIPFAVLLISYLINRGDGEYDLFKVFTNKTDTTSTSDALAYPDPTAIEFRVLLRKIIDGTFINKNNRLIIVIDNLDRLSEEVSINVWSGLLSFLNQESLKDYESNEKIWVIAPFDFQRAFFKRTHTGDAIEFINKAFQVVFRISRPLMVDWKNFLIEKLNDSFRSISDKESHTIYRLVQILHVFDGKNEHPTPRIIKRFVNDLSALVRTWGDEKPISILALYSLISKELTHSPNKIEFLKRIDKDKITILINCPDWKKEMLSIHYSADADRVYHALFGEQIMSALNDNVNGLNEIKKIKEYEGFWETIESLLDTLHANDTALFCNTVVILDKLDIPDTYALTLWRNLTHKLLVLEGFGYIRDQIGNALIIIIERSNDRSRALKKVIELFSNFGSPDAIHDEVTLGSWSESIFIIFNHFEDDQECLSLFKNFLKVPFTLDSYIKILGILTLKGSRTNLVNYLKTDISFSDILEELVTRIKGDDYTYSQSSFFPYLKNIFAIEKADIYPIIDLIYRKQSPKVSQTATSFGSHVETLLFINIYYDEFKPSFSDEDDISSVSEEIFYWAHKYEKDTISYSRALLFQVLTIPHLKNEFMRLESLEGAKSMLGFLHSPKEGDLLNELVEFSIEHNITSELLHVYKNFQYKGIAEIITKMMSSGKRHSLFTKKMLSENRDLFDRFLSKESDSRINE